MLSPPRTPASFQSSPTSFTHAVQQASRWFFFFFLECFSSTRHWCSLQRFHYYPYWWSQCPTADHPLIPRPLQFFGTHFFILCLRLSEPPISMVLTQTCHYQQLQLLCHLRSRSHSLITCYRPRFSPFWDLTNPTPWLMAFMAYLMSFLPSSLPLTPRDSHLPFFHSSSALFPPTAVTLSWRIAPNYPVQLYMATKSSGLTYFTLNSWPQSTLAPSAQLLER